VGELWCEEDATPKPVGARTLRGVDRAYAC